MFGNVHVFLSSTNSFSNLAFFKNLCHKYYQSVKQFGSRSDQDGHSVGPDLGLFANVNRGLQKFPLARKELGEVLHAVTTFQLQSQILIDK